MIRTRPKIAYLCDLSPFDEWSYSGGNARILDSLQKHVGDVTVLGNSWHSVEFIRGALNRMPEAIVLRARWRLHALLSKFIARGVKQEIRRQNFDVLFCSYSFHSLLNLNLPGDVLSVFTSDATPTTYKNSEVGARFGSFFSPSRFLDPLILSAERKVFSSADLLLWPSDWLKTKADNLYGLSEAQSHLVPWGANIAAPGKGSLNLNSPMDGPVRLLFIGRDWFAKGGPIAVQVLEYLNASQIDAHLTIVGCTPPDEFVRSEMTIFPLLDKNKQEERAIFEGLLREAHFFLLPSFESYGFAFTEASAYGLPSLGLRVGGVPIKEGVNGHALPVSARAEEFAGKILKYRENRTEYAALRASSRSYFEKCLNWDSWGETVAALIEAKLAGKGLPPASG